MTAVDEPSRWDRTIYQGTDHAWSLRRLSGTTPIIPTSARAQIRRGPGTGDVWLDLTSAATTGPRIAIDAVTGWLQLVIPRTATEGPEWDDRWSGAWDLEVDVAGVRYRWASGAISVDHDVTRDVA